MTRIIKAATGDEHTPDKADVLNLADFADEARNVVLDARKEAARISAEARAKAQSVQREGREQGYAEGFARSQIDGYAEGVRKGRQEVVERYGQEYSALLQQAGRIVSGLSAAGQDAAAQASSQVIEMAMMLAERIVGSVSACNPSAAVANLAKALELAHRGGQVVVSVNPVELNALQRELPALMEAISVTGSVELVDDRTISPGGVKLSSSRGEIDATIESQLANVARALLGHDPRKAKGKNKRPVDTGRYVRTPEGTLKPTSYV